MLYKSLVPKKLLVPLNALLPGLSGGLAIKFPLINKDSLIAMFLSPSQATNPILASLLSITFKRFYIIYISYETETSFGIKYLLLSTNGAYEEFALSIITGSLSGNLVSISSHSTFRYSWVFCLLNYPYYILIMNF